MDDTAILKSNTKQDFGRTWWGQQWLKALDRIDFDNRLDRGKSYARKGAVSTIKITNNIIEAKVNGSRPKPYIVNIIVPPFFDPEKNIFLNNIKGNPLILSRLLNRELPTNLMEIAEKNKVKLFPQSWQDIKLNCNCPDWAVPCKHLAAVIYMIANEIDQNPFLVFKLHNFDLLAELAKLNINISSLEKERIICFDDCIEEKKPKAANLLLKEIPDFSLVENLQQIIPNLFLSNTLFYSGDFKSQIQSVYKHAAKLESKSLQIQKAEAKSIHEEKRFHDFKINFSNNGTILIESSINGKQNPLTLEQLLILLAQTESKHLVNYSDSFNVLYRAFRFCNILVERSGILPRIFQYSADTHYKIQWVPALLNDSINKVFQSLLDWLPSDSVYIQKGIDKKTSKTSTAKQVLSTNKEEALMLVCSLFINNSIKGAFNLLTLPKKYTAIDTKVFDIFFNDKVHSFSQFSEQQIPNSIHLWLKRFFIGNKDVTPIIQVTELNNDEGFEVEILVKSIKKNIASVESLYTFLRNNIGEQKMQLLKNLNLLGEYYPELNVVIETEGKQKLKYTTETLSDILRKVLPALNLFGIKALLPKSLRNLLKPQVTMALSAKEKNRKYFSLDDLISFEWRVAMGNTFITQAEFEALAKNTYGLVKIKEEYVMMDEELVKKVIERLEKPRMPNSFQLLQAALCNEYDNSPVQIDRKLKNEIDKLLKAEETTLPKNSIATLRPYQYRGFSWLYKNAKLGLGSVLADDMGLGKTVQVITALLKFKEEGFLKNQPALVVVPTTLLTNWANELKKFSPDLNLHTFHGPGRKFETKDIDVVITTYGVARTDLEKLKKTKWYAVIVDEAQNIKNPDIAQTKSIKSIPAKIKIAMSGTPVENRLSEYWSIFDFANPGYLGNINWFNTEFAKPIEINQDKKQLKNFKAVTAPFIMRRIKTDKSIIDDLPEKIENNQYCSLTKEQAALYKNITHDLMLEIEQAEGINRRGIILKLLVVLKQICNHPAQYLKNDHIIPELSGKAQLLLQILENIYENNEKVLIFSQYKEMAEMLQQIIHAHFGKKSLLLHGGCTRAQRDEMVDAFQNTKMADTFILSLKAGGTGLNLTAAANVIHFDLWWNPAVEAQATDRAFRIGQKQNVIVHRLITKGTLEEKIDAMIISKKKLANLTVATGEKWLGELNDKELKQLISLEV
ncbi:MAG: DEAD/DEAH box helicase [Bacteroidota bacterium]|nr:DEAD/DEAH box helicase [Bacteroidota bacterium]